MERKENDCSPETDDLIRGCAPMSPFLALPPRSLSEALREISEQREADPNQVFRLDRMRNEQRVRSQP